MLMQRQLKRKESSVSIRGCYRLFLQVIKFLLQCFPPAPNGSNLLGNCKGRCFEYYALHLGISKCQNLNSEISKTQTLLKICVLSQQHEVASLSQEKQLDNLPPLCKMCKKFILAIFTRFCHIQIGYCPTKIP